MEERLEHIRALGYDYAIRVGYSDLADDFAQWYVILCWRRELEGKPFKLPAHPWVDYLRTVYGRFGKGIRAKRYSEIPFEEYMPKMVRRLDLDKEEALGKILKLCKSPMEKGAFVLRHHWGFSDTEIADVFQVTGSRICKLTSDVMELAERERIKHEKTINTKRTNRNGELGPR